MLSSSPRLLGMLSTGLPELLSCQTMLQYPICCRIVAVAVCQMLSCPCSREGGYKSIWS